MLHLLLQSSVGCRAQCLSYTLYVVCIVALLRAVLRCCVQCCAVRAVLRRWVQCCAVACSVAPVLVPLRRYVLCCDVENCVAMLSAVLRCCVLSGRTSRSWTDANISIPGIPGSRLPGMKRVLFSDWNSVTAPNCVPLFQ